MSAVPYIDESGSAFPGPRSYGIGLTKREYFAAEALNGWAAGRQNDIESFSHAQIAASCFAYADAMIAASKTRPESP